MGRKAMSNKHKLAKQRERQQKYLSNDDALARTRDSNRLRIQERRRREQQAWTLPIDMATRAEIMRYISEDEDENEEDEEDENQCSDLWPSLLIYADNWNVKVEGHHSPRIQSGQGLIVINLISG
jgi:hypothetical protein